MGDLALAVRHLELAETVNLAMGNRPCHAISLATLADALEATGPLPGGERAAFGWSASAPGQLLYLTTSAWATCTS